ncbi:hypothetical protein [Planctomycetes bacterium TBK1r]
MIRQPFPLTVTRPIRRKGCVVNTCACLTRIVLRYAFPQQDVAAQRNVPALPPEHSPRAPCVLRIPSKIEARVSPPRFVRLNHRSIVVIDPSIVVDPSSTIVPSMKHSIANRTRSDEEQKPKSDVVTRNPPEVPL